MATGGIESIPPLSFAPEIALKKKFEQPWIVDCMGRDLQPPKK
jgi:hypothetical protein